MALGPETTHLPYCAFANLLQRFMTIKCIAALAHYTGASGYFLSKYAVQLRCSTWGRPW